MKTGFRIGFTYRGLPFCYGVHVSISLHLAGNWYKPVIRSVRVTGCTWPSED